MDRSASSPAAPLLVLAAAALWGTTGTAQALGGAGDPVVVAAARLVVGSTALALVVVVTGGTGALVRCLRPPSLAWTLTAAVATAIFQAAFFSAVATTGVTTGTVVALGTAPVATGLCAAAFFSEPLTRRWAGATVLAVTGCTVLVGAAGPGASTVEPAGVVLAVVAGTCYGLYTTAAKALLEQGVPVVAAVTTTLGLGAVTLAPVLVLRAGELAGARPLLMVAWLGLATTAAAYLLFAYGLRRLPAATVGTLSLAEPLTAATLGLVVLGERPGPWAVAGGLCLLLGLVLVALRPHRTGAGVVATPRPTTTTGEQDLP
ncbi:EamA family transporter [Pseudokineococcus basanitobsidens]|uniref:EamA family transporter n=1 Tax=Pseudokineococcus basanitobsidens TaxID=1926649 RepID=A0ABU8RKZ3_9ACTN